MHTRAHDLRFPPRGLRGARSTCSARSSQADLSGGYSRFPSCASALIFRAVSTMERHLGNGVSLLPACSQKFQSSEIIRREGTMNRHSVIWCGLAAALTVSGPAWGQDYPNRQITILVGIAAGGITDVTTRQYAAVVSKNMDQNIIVENRPVAGGAVAAATVQSAAPDGYTLLSVVFSPSAFENRKNNQRNQKVPRGGSRQGAGRKTGQMTKMTRVIAEEAFERGVAPLEVMLDNMRFAHASAESLSKRIKEDDGHPGDLKVLKELLRLRQMSEKWAKAAAPYIHSRLRPVEPRAAGAA
jgi:hypothetical protein